MTSDQPHEDLEFELLEQNLVRELGQKQRADLAESIRHSLETDPGHQQKDTGMITASASQAWRDPERSIIARKWWAVFANVASVGAIVFLIARIWSGDFEPEHDQSQVPVTHMLQDEGEIPDHNEITIAPLVTNITEIRELQPGLLGLKCAGDNIDDKAVLEICRSQPQLQFLELRSTRVTGQGITRLQDLRSLTTLGLPGNDYIDRAGWKMVGMLKTLGALNLNLFMGQTASMDEDEEEIPRAPKKGISPGPFLISSFGNLPDLKQLDLQGHRYSDRDMVNLGAATNNRIEKLDISYTGVTSSAIESLATWHELRVLRAIDVGTGKKPTLQPFKRLWSLETLTIGANGMSSVKYDLNDIQVLVELPRLHTLELQNVTFANGQVKTLAKIQTLKSLSLFRCFKLTDDDCRELATMAQVERLSIVFCKGIHEEGVKFLAQSRATVLDLRGTVADLSPIVIKEILDTRPELSIRISNNKKALSNYKQYIAGSFSPSDLILQAQEGSEPFDRR